MALAANALTTVAALRSYMHQSATDVDLLSVYHDQSASATAATVQVTASSVVLVITGGANAGTDTFTFAAYATVTTLVAAINALAQGWVATVLATGSETPGYLRTLAATSAFGSANTQYLRGVDSLLLETTINAASDRIERYCNRTFASATYRHLFSGTGTARLPLRERPVTSVIRVALGFSDGLRVENTSTDAKAATVGNDGTSLTFKIIGGAGAGTSTIALGTNTINQIVTAVDALGNGWNATVAGTAQGAWPATELLRHEHLDALNQELPLVTPGETLDSYLLDGDAGVITLGYGDRNYPDYLFGRSMIGGTLYPVLPHSYHNPGSHPGRLWPVGSFNVYVNYVAGYASIPDDLAMACAKLASNLIRGGTRDGQTQSFSVPSYSESFSLDGTMSKDILHDLAPFRLKPYPRVLAA